MISELTSSVLILRRDPGSGWLVALVWHPRLDCWLAAGGHVEAGETPAEAAVREAREETGLDVTLVPGPAARVPAAFPHRVLPAPWLVAEAPASPDRHTNEAHVHVDHLYVAVADCGRPAAEPEHHVRWFTPAGIAAAPAVSEDSRLLAAQLLALAAPQPGPQFTWPPEQVHGTTVGQQPGATDRIEGTSCTGGNVAPRLIVIRGNSASGKSAVASAIRERHGQHDLSIVSQDLLRRVVLRERDVPGGANIALIDMTARHAINSGFHVIVEGILRADYYGEMLTRLIGDQVGRAHAYFLHVPFDETLKRHAAKPQASEYGETELRAWYRGLDLLPGGLEKLIPAESSLDDTIREVMTDASLTAL
jgi:8-oxo-dGTP pyrophosphatase MutT (NUDIX family)